MSTKSLSAGFAERYDLSWMDAADITTRLDRSLALVRNLIAIPYPGIVRVAWASVADPFEGVMIQGDPPRILINPRLVVSHAPEERYHALDALCGVALHEASHVAFTPRGWGQRLAQQRSAFQERTGYRLPDGIVIPILNWAEDVYIESRLVRDYPGFRAYFRNTWSYFLPATTCQRRLTAATRALNACRRKSPNTKAMAKLAARLLEVLVVAVQRPDILERQLPVRFPVVVDAAREIQQAGGTSDLDDRLEMALGAADAIFRYLREFLNGAAADQPVGTAGTRSNPGDVATNVSNNYRGKPEDGASSAETGADDVAQVDQLDDALKRLARYKESPLWRDAGEPLGTQPVAKRKLRQLYKDSDHVEQPAAGMAAAQSNDTNDTSEVFIDEGRRVHILDSSRAVLPDPPENLESIAEELFTEHRALATELRRRLRFRDTVVERAVHGQRRGELDEYQLVDVVAGDRNVFAQREQVESPQVDLTLLIDESGSMSRDGRWRLAAATAVCIEYAVRPLTRVRLRVIGFTGDLNEREPEVVLYRHYDSATSRLHRPQALGYLYPKGSTPTGMALAGMRRLLREELRLGGVVTSVLLLSDGLPEARGYGGRPSIDHVAAQARTLIASGIHFAALQVGSDASEQQLGLMYGQHWQRIVRPAEIPTAVIALVLTHLT